MEAWDQCHPVLHIGRNEKKALICSKVFLFHPKFSALHGTILFSSLNQNIFVVNTPIPMYAILRRSNASKFSGIWKCSIPPKQQ